MHRIYAKPFLDVQDMLVQFSIIGQDAQRGQRLIENSNTFVAHLNLLITEMQVPELDMCRKAAERLRDHLQRHMSPRQIIHDVQELRGRLIDQIDSLTFLALSQSERALLEPAGPLFGPQVEAKFAEMSEDISEAGKCLALNRATAAVFHLMRVMEKALQCLGTELGIALVDGKNWQNILDEANKAIKGLPAKGARTKVLSEAAAHLYAVKLAWRNEVMHPKQTYTGDEADEIYRHVRAFMRDLAGLL
jgi:hypothetical protein